MKKIILGCVILFCITGCGINRQQRELKALEDCKYEISSADSLYISGVAVKEIVKDKQVDLSKMPALAFGFLRKNIPLEGKINLQITNPGVRKAAINQFQYLILIKDQQIVDGFVNQKVSIEPGETVVVPVKLKSNIYKLLNDQQAMDEILNFLSGGNTKETEKTGVVTIKIKPTIAIGNKLINYPGYITVNKELSSKVLF